MKSSRGPRFTRSLCCIIAFTVLMQNCSYSTRRNTFGQEYCISSRLDIPRRKRVASVFSNTLMRLKGGKTMGRQGKQQVTGTSNSKQKPSGENVGKNRRKRVEKRRRRKEKQRLLKKQMLKQKYAVKRQSKSREGHSTAGRQTNLGKNPVNITYNDDNYQKQLQQLRLRYTPKQDISKAKSAEETEEEEEIDDCEVLKEAELWLRKEIGATTYDDILEELKNYDNATNVHSSSESSDNDKEALVDRTSVKLRKNKKIRNNSSTIQADIMRLEQAYERASKKLESKTVSRKEKEEAKRLLRSVKEKKRFEEKISHLRNINASRPVKMDKDEDQLQEEIGKGILTSSDGEDEVNGKYLRIRSETSIQEYLEDLSTTFDVTKQSIRQIVNSHPGKTVLSLMQSLDKGYIVTTFHKYIGKFVDEEMRFELYIHIKHDLDWFRRHVLGTSEKKQKEINGGGRKRGRLKG